MAGSCTGYHWSHGQYTLANCTQESSTFFIILGFTMLVLLILLGLIFVIACFRQQRRLNAAPSATTTEGGGVAGGPGNCVVQIDGHDADGGQAYAKNLDSVKCVIMAGDDKPTFLAHPVVSSPPKALEYGDLKQEEQEVVGETSQKQERQDDRV